MRGGSGVCFRREKSQTVFRKDCGRKEAGLRGGGGGCVRKIKEELGVGARARGF